jgi:hypothetical protein
MTRQISPVPPPLSVTTAAENGPKWKATDLRLLTEGRGD